MTTINYHSWISEIKNKIKSAQLKAALTVNKELILFYWELGQDLSEKLILGNWGDKILEDVSRDLKKEFPNIKGFSTTNLKYIKRFYEYFNSISIKEWNLISQQDDKRKSAPVLTHDPADNQSDVIGHQAGDQLQTMIDFIINEVAVIPWRHIVEIFTKSQSIEETIFYVKKVRENNWSRNILLLQIKSDLFNRTGKSINNFKNTLPVPMSDLAHETLKDPYIFDFLSLSEKFYEKELETHLVQNIRKLMLELGKGFAFVGEQYNINIANKDYYIDLLFYHIKLKCYVVIELKNTEFKPEYAGKLNFYLSAVDTILKDDNDHPSIGILLCNNKNNIEVEFALRDIKKPIGVSEFDLTNQLPEEYKSVLPTIEEIEKSILE